MVAVAVPGYVLSPTLIVQSVIPAGAITVIYEGNWDEITVEPSVCADPVPISVTATSPIRQMSNPIRLIISPQ
ncbi:MAG TPA: hypothetical protein PK377_11055 [Methanothrix sp.]|jgi:hypothetical protein|nr:hypothetical protein [Methanothrix sp.]